jgi:hypothetical protein
VNVWFAPLTLNVVASDPAPVSTTLIKRLFGVSAVVAYTMAPVTPAPHAVVLAGK